MSLFCNSSTARSDLNKVHAFNNFPEHDVLAVDPLGLSGANEKLRIVGVWTGVSHGEDSRTGVLLNEILICELVVVNRFSAGSVNSGEISSLAHEIQDHMAHIHCKSETQCRAWVRVEEKSISEIAT
ncbi:hypothetical protein L2E82_21182 [Cichorium intybus]|uniref:Uncharacterized protein n=1 Tax=Cichorium intybus TaxID=13427 RepID=A0ACB9DVP3_CICIN|nr:hypothetical protein L2E82_21182 [Cichorium intybus]